MSKLLRSHRGPLLAWLGILLVVVLSSVWGAAPDWWTTRGVIAPGATASDQSPATQGQLKNMARAAMEEMGSQPGSATHAMVTGWINDPSQARDQAVVTVGQLKAVVKPFLDEIGLPYPWTATTTDDADSAMATVGQLKAAFSFTISAAPTPTPEPTPTPNIAPWVDAGPNRSTTATSLVMTANATDADASPQALTYQWRQENDPGSPVATFSNAAVLNPTVTFPAAGTYTLRLSVSDGSALRSDVVLIHRSESGTQPTISLTSPASNAIFAHPATVTLQATATNTVKVEYYSGDKLIGESTTAPYTVSWSPPHPREYRLTAKAIGSSGNLARFSAARTIQIGDTPTNPTNNTNDPDPNDPDYDLETSDQDEDGLTDAEEIRIGTDPGTKHSDTDGVPDGLDGWANDPDLFPPRLPEPHYAVIKLSDLDVTGRPNRIADNGAILWVHEDSQTHENTYKLWVNGSSTDVHHINMSRDGTKFVDLKAPDYTSSALPLFVDEDALSSPANSDWAADISNSGTVVGSGSVFSIDPAPEAQPSWRSVLGAVVWPQEGAPQDLLARLVQVQGEDMTLSGGDKQFYPLMINSSDDVIGSWSEVIGETPESGIGYIAHAQGPSSAMEELPKTAPYAGVHGINDLDPRWISGSDNGAVYWVKIGTWKRKLVLDETGAPVAGTAAFVNNRAEMVVLNDNGDPVGIVSNAIFRQFSDLCPNYDDTADLVDLNNHGVVLTTTELLIPYELSDTRKNDDANDDVSIEPKKTVEEKKDKSIAWIWPHDEANNSPKMPQLALKISAAESMNLKIKWKLQVIYQRPRGSSPNETQIKAQDEVFIPAKGTGDQPWREGPLDGVVEFYDDADWTTAINQKGFFGGEAELTFQLLKSDGSVLSDEIKLLFSIGGKNPDDDKAKTYIDTKSGTADSRLTRLSYAVAKHESKDYNGGGSRYNEFWEGYARRYGIDHRKGDPLWCKAPSESSAGGFAMFQITGNLSSQFAIIPREQFWNWQKNTDAYVTIVKTGGSASKGSVMDRFFAAVARTYPSDSEAQTPPTSFAYDGGNYDAWEMGTITLYNGAGGCPRSKLKNASGKWTSLTNPWTYNPSASSGSRWKYNKNSNNYLHEVIQQR